MDPNGLAMPPGYSLQELSDRMEIEQLLVRYGHAVDQRDWDSYRDVCTQEAVIDDVSAGPGNSVADMVAFLSRALVRTPHGWKISKRAEQDYFHNLPEDFRFE